MLVSYNWLKEYVDISESPEVLAEMITRAGVEIGGISYPAEGISGVVVAEVLTCEPLADSDHLNLCQVSTGSGDPLQVVCGAPNVAAGQKVCFAQVGAVLPGNFEIKKAELRGVTSNGMICSMQELGVDDALVAPADKDGIRVLPADAPLGEDALAYLGLNDAIFDLDLTPNRSDCLSVYNVAREVGALLNRPVRPLDVAFSGQAASDEGIQVTVDAPELCHRYIGTRLLGVKPGRSPLWMEQRLQAAGMRPLGVLVDITNYVMLETGQPLHAFDEKDIAGREIIVRRAKDGEHIVTLDDVDRELTNEMLLICDRDRAVGIAGVMGGENTEIKDDTENIFLESAYFEPRNVRRTAQKLGLRTEASIRNEKGVSIKGVELAAQRAAALFERLAGAQVIAPAQDVYPVEQPDTLVPLRFARANALLGTDIPPETMVSYLTRLQFDLVEEGEEGVQVRVPDWRMDVTIEEDLIEEIARFYGYDEIPATLPYGSTNPGGLTEKQRLQEAIGRHLVAAGLHEVLTYSFVAEDFADKLHMDPADRRREVIAIDNPLSAQLAVMRTSLVHSILEAVQVNRSHQVADVAIFERAKTYRAEGDLTDRQLATEEDHLVIALDGGSNRDWLGSRQAYDFFYLKGIIEQLFTRLDLAGLRWEACTDDPTWHPGRTARVYLNDTLLGLVGQVHPLVCQNYDLSEAVYCAELNLEPLYALGVEAPKAETPSRYPAVMRDLALVVPADLSHADISRTIRAAASSDLRDIVLFDRYTGDQVADGMASMAYSLAFQNKEQTLTDDQVEKDMEAILAACKDLGATIRE
ncbi:phenylalanine--tRNA ligase subunit beta [Peptococcus simiae]|uniref:Phenylalanine--tRNA ligase beta subunit n=1 Tax=Peptococcus simiae TaxID=1643805 RepID=A0ABW9GYM6_9FIRM